MGKTDLWQGHRIKPHRLRRYRVNRNLVCARKDQVLLVPAHRPWARPITSKCTVHDGKYSRVDLLLDRQKIDQCFVDDGVRPMAIAMQQSAERVFHGAGHLSKHVRLDGGEVDDVFAGKGLRDEQTVWENVVQHKHVALWRIRNPSVWRHIKCDAWDTVLFLDNLVLILGLALKRVDHHGPVVRGHQIIVPVRLELLDHSVHLPRSCGASGVIVLPRQIDLEECLRPRGERFLVVGEFE